MICTPAGKLSRGGFTLLEIVAVMLILTIVAVLFVPEMKGMLARAGEAACMANMRSINVGLHGYLQDHSSVWPQGPSPNDQDPWEEFWLATLQPYGITDRTWQCPTLRSQLSSQRGSRAAPPKVHYIPTMFSATPGAATRWATHPWLIERSSVHGHGPLICFPDGSVKSFFKVLAEQGVR